MIARALRRAAEEEELDVPRASGFEASKGRGVRAEIDGTQWRVGGPNMLDGLDLEPGETPSQLRAGPGREGAYGGLSCQG